MEKLLWNYGIFAQLAVDDTQVLPSAASSCGAEARAVHLFFKPYMDGTQRTSSGLMIKSTEMFRLWHCNPISVLEAFKPTTELWQFKSATGPQCAKPCWSRDIPNLTGSFDSLNLALGCGISNLPQSYNSLVP